MLAAGVDSSTQSTKVVLCRAEDGQVVGLGSAPHPAGTECDPQAWWTALELAGDGLLTRAAAVGVAGQPHLAYAGGRSPASCSSAEPPAAAELACRSWRSVQPRSAGSSGRVEAVKISAARRYDIRDRPVTGQIFRCWARARARRPVTNTGPALRPVPGVGSALFNTFWMTTLQQQVSGELLARADSFVTFGAFGPGTAGLAAAGPVAAALGAGRVLRFGAAWAALSSLVVLAVPAISSVTWRTYGAGAGRAGADNHAGGHPLDRAGTGSGGIMTSGTDS